MDELMKNLKNEMKKKVFKGVSFSDERKSAVLETIRQKQNHTSWDEQTILVVLEIIQNEPKHGYDISTDLYRRQEFSFQKSEGQLYTLLHTLETQGLINSKWLDEKKYYLITKRGTKFLASYKQAEPRKIIELNHIVEEARW